ncbi:hypothetical protein WAX78_02985 [Bacillus sp. FJAT-53711]|uniref:NlpC/P60 domain-containing protein n=1 Tax=Bacillus yunxiaonensis TaxID=3127665 RepID=A0ABU8FR32_9BACI
MYTVKNNQISDEVIKRWQDMFVPDGDYFFFEKKPAYCKVDERNAVYIPLDKRTAFLTWNVRKEASYIARISNDEFLTLDNQIQKQILKEQVRLQRGFIFELYDLRAIFQNDAKTNQIEWESWLERYAFSYENKQLIILQGYMWRELSEQLRILLLLHIAEMFVYEDSVLIKGLMKNHITPFINEFIDTNGPNCLAATLAAVETDKRKSNEYINEWMQPNKFSQILCRKNFEEIDTTIIQEGDVLVWEQGGLIVHACYALTHHLVFNKDGQTMFNAYQCITVEQVMRNWEHVLERDGRFIIHRKRRKSIS